MEDNIKKSEVAKATETIEENVKSENLDEKVTEKVDGVVYKTEVDDDITTTTIDELAKETKKDSKGDSSEDDEAKKKEKKRNVAKAKKRNKKLRKWLIILAVIALVIFIGVKYVAFSATKLINEMSSVTSIDKVEKMDLASTISATGTIQSKDVRTLTSALAGVTIEQVNYEVGDMVTEGAVVVAFSREDINKKIDNLQEDIDEATASKSLDSGNRNADYNYNYGTEAYNMANAGTRTAQAQQDLNNAYSDLSKVQQNKSDFMAKYNTAIENKDSVYAELEEVKRLYQVWQKYIAPEVFSDVLGGGAMAATPEEYAVAMGCSRDDWNKIVQYYYYLTTVDAWNDHISELQTKYSEYEATIKNYDSQLSSYDSQITSAERSITNAQRTYDSALNTQTEQMRTSANNLQKYDYNLAKGNLTAEDQITNYKRQLEEYVDRLDDYVVYAPISGLVTEVNAQEGNGYQATTGALMTIQAVDIYEVTTQIDEYDIPNVKVGQKVVIITDATGDEELEGVVSFIAPTATSTSSAATAANSSSSATYKVNIDILTKNDKLMLGMSAKVNIITEQHNGILAVRYDAIEEDEQGNKVVYVVSDEDAKANEKKTEDGISVVGMDDDKNNPKGFMPAAKKEKNEQTFIQYLFGGGKTDVGSEEFKLKNAAKKVIVDIGIEGDYYTEVKSNELTDGSNVLVNNESGALNDMMMMFNGMGGPGGM